MTRHTTHDALGAVRTQSLSGKTILPSTLAS